MIGIYKITNPTNKIYIGQSTNIKNRFITYKQLHCKKQPALYSSLLKYGFEKHKFEIIVECEVYELNEKERYYQDLYNCIKTGLNCKLTKSSDRSGFLSEETKIKISNAKKGKKQSASHSLKISLGKKGKKRSKEIIEIIRNTHKGKKVSLETKIKISNSLKGKTPYNKGIPLSKEAVIKRTDKQAHVYINLDTFIFYSFIELQEYYNIKSTTLRRKITNKKLNIMKVLDHTKEEAEKLLNAKII